MKVNPGSRAKWLVIRESRNHKMSRSGYSDDCDDYGQANLYRYAVTRGLAGPRGQGLLREMVAALDAMPVRELAAEVFVNGDTMCAMGAVARARGVPAHALAQLDEHDPDSVGTLLGIPESLAREIAYENDEAIGGDESDRWHHMRSWAAANIVERKPTPTGKCSWCCKVFTLRAGRGYVVNRHKYNGAPCDGAGKPAAPPPSDREGRPQ
jgi:hypothetical protein